jgi:hypothetical protein
MSGERKLSNQNQRLFDEMLEREEEEEVELDREEMLLATLLLLLHRVDKEHMELTEEEERRWCTFMNLKRRVNKVYHSHNLTHFFCGTVPLRLILDFRFFIYLFVPKYALFAGDSNVSSTAPGA